MGFRPTSPAAGARTWSRSGPLPVAARSMPTGSAGRTRRTWAARAAPRRFPMPRSAYYFLSVSVSGTSVTITPTDELGRTFDPITYNAPALNANLSLTKTDSPDPVLVGQQVTYDLTVDNAGPRAATGTVVTDTLPAGMIFDSATPSQGMCSHTSGTVTCQLGTVGSGATRRSRSRAGRSRPAPSTTPRPSRPASTTRAPPTTPRMPRPPSTRPQTWPSPRPTRPIPSGSDSSSLTRSASATPARRARPGSRSPTRCPRA